MSSAKVVCCKKLPNITDKLSMDPNSEAPEQTTPIGASKQCGPRTDCSYRSSLFWVQAVCFYT